MLYVHFRLMQVEVMYFMDARYDAMHIAVCQVICTKLVRATSRLQTGLG